MILAEYLKANDYAVDKALCLTIGTDGLKYDKDNLLSISFASESIAPSTIYIGGAHVEQVEQYTGVSRKYYDSKRMALDEAVSKVNSILEEHDFLVCYNYKFLFNFASILFPLIADFQYLDLTTYLDVRKNGGELTMETRDLDDLGATMRSFMTGRHRGSFEEHVRDYLSPIEDAPVIVERKIKELQLLWKVAMYV
jgi:hypothetical protein